MKTSTAWAWGWDFGLGKWAEPDVRLSKGGGGEQSAAKRIYVRMIPESVYRKLPKATRAKIERQTAEVLP